MGRGWRGWGEGRGAGPRGRSEKTPHNQKLLARAHKTLKTEWWTDNGSVTHPNKGTLLVGLGPNYWYKEQLGGTSKTWCEVREASLQRWPTVWFYLYDIWGRRNWGSDDPVRSPLGETESDHVLDCGCHRNLMCAKIHRPMLDTERKKRQCLCTMLSEVKWVILSKNHQDDSKQISGCHELLVGLATRIILREFSGSDRNI